jgi:hypothetical protein
MSSPVKDRRARALILCCCWSLGRSVSLWSTCSPGPAEYGPVFLADTNAGRQSDRITRNDSARSAEIANDKAPSSNGNKVKNSSQAIPLAFLIRTIPRHPSLEAMRLHLTLPAAGNGSAGTGSGGAGFGGTGGASGSGGVPPTGNSGGASRVSGGGASAVAASAYRQDRLARLARLARVGYACRDAAVCPHAYRIVCWPVTKRDPGANQSDCRCHRPGQLQL